MSKINNYEALVRNFSGYEEALLKATHGAEVPYRHLSAAITVEKDEEKRTLLVNSKTFGPYSGGPIGYDAGNCAMIKLNDFLVDAGKLTGWSVKSIEISESELSLLSSVSKLPVFDDYANQRKTILAGALSQMFKAFSVASGNDETALNIDNTDKETLENALKNIMEKNSASADFCNPSWCVNDDMILVPCFAYAGKCGNPNCPYRKFICTAQ